MGLRDRCLDVSGWDQDPNVLGKAVEMGMLQSAPQDPVQLASSCDLIVLAVPLGEIVPLGLRLIPHLNPHAVLMDTGSTKGPIVEELDRALPGRYLGFHPMAGRERGGLENASPHLFHGALCALVRGPRSTDRTVQAGVELAQELGADWEVMGSEEHDRGAALVSHLPMLVSAALAGVVMDASMGLGRAKTLASSGFRDVTRLSLGGGSLLLSLIQMNRGFLEEALEEFIRQARGLLSGDEGMVARRLDEIARWRRDLALRKGWVN